MTSTSRLFTALALCPLSSASFAGTLFVDANLATGAGDGSTWADAFQGPDGLQAALAAAVAGDEIYVAEGTYLPTSTGSRTVSFRLKSGVEVYGSFLGGESSPAERPAFGSAPSILSGDLSGNDGANQLTDNSFHVVHGASTNSTAVLDGFEVRGGNSNSNGGNDRGGGIICQSSSSPTIRNCFFIGNRCTFGGGAGYINGSAPQFLGCTFEDNLGGSFGGAFDIASSSGVRFDRCTFSGNSASRAGALEIFATTNVFVTNSIFINNTATGASGGGGLWIGNGGSTQVHNCTIVSNNATVQAAGGLRNQGSSVTVTNTILWDNSGPGGAQGAGNQIEGVVATYSIIEGGGAGVGTLALDPQFENLATGLVGLMITSPAIDAGNNNSVMAGFNYDHANGPRIRDEQTVADTGVGIAPVVDIGALEYSDPKFDSFCYGDGSGTACPCNNDSLLGHAGGCAHQNGDGAILAATGNPSIANDTLQFAVTSGAANTFSVMMSGDNRLPLVGNVGAGVQVFDGLRCAEGAVRSHGARPINFLGIASGWGPGTISAQGNFAAGQTRHFFVFFRTHANQTCNSGVNSSNGVSVTFVN